jgi:hypothetical protein
MPDRLKNDDNLPGASGSCLEVLSSNPSTTKKKKKKNDDDQNNEISLKNVCGCFPDLVVWW